MSPHHKPRHRGPKGAPPGPQRGPKGVPKAPSKGPPRGPERSQKGVGGMTAQPLNLTLRQRHCHKFTKKIPNLLQPQWRLSFTDLLNPRDLLGPPGGHLEPFWNHSAPWRPLGGPLETSWSPVGGLLEASWTLLAPPELIWELLKSAKGPKGLPRDHGIA